MNFLKRAFDIFNLLSLNVVFGAIICSAMFWKLPDGAGQLDGASLLLLGVCTWIIYIADRLWDLKIYPSAPTIRHNYHKKQQYNLSVLLILLVTMAVVLCFLIPIKIFWYGVIISSCLGLYFLILNKFMKTTKMQWLKEPTTAVCYTLAVVGIAFVNHSSINASSWILAFMFFLIASQNLLLFSYFEKFSHPNIKNTVDLFGQLSSKRLVRILGFLVLFLAIFLFSSGWQYIHKVGLILAIMSQILSFMLAKTDFFLKNDSYRWVGDGVFILPILILLL
jgi:hypothetical protein